MGGQHAYFQKDNTKVALYSDVINSIECFIIRDNEKIAKTYIIVDDNFKDNIEMIEVRRIYKNPALNYMNYLNENLIRDGFYEADWKFNDQYIWEKFNIIKDKQTIYIKVKYL